MPTLVPVYGRGQSEYHLLPAPIFFQNAPTSSQSNYAIGQLVYTGTSGASVFYIYSGAGIWTMLSDADGPVESVLGTANQVTVSTASGIATVSLPSAITAPGSLTTTTTLTATSGNITATNGNVVMSTAGTGIVGNVVTASGAASGPVVCNGRMGSVTFTGVSIAAGADLTLTVTNSSITGSGTFIMYDLRGVTTGAALSKKSVTNTAGSSAIVITNGTGATTTTADITLNFIVMN